MSANVESMFSVRQMPWHREGDILGEYPGSWAEARVPAGLDWDPVEEPVFELHSIGEDGQPIYAPIEGWNRIVRNDTDATLWLARESYTLITNGDMGMIIEAVLAQSNVKYETAGSLDGGRQVWALAMLDEPIELPGDNTVVMPYMALTNRHGPSGGATLRATSVRIVCANTFSAAELEGERTGTTYSFRHTANWRDRVEQARDAVTGARKEMHQYVELATELLGVRITPAQRELFVTTFIPSPPEGLVTDRVVNNVETARAALRSILTSPTTAHVADTGFGLVQAAGEYLDHVRRARSWETRLGRTLIKPEPLKAKALKLVHEITKAG